MALSNARTRVQNETSLASRAGVSRGTFEAVLNGTDQSAGSPASGGSEPGSARGTSIFGSAYVTVCYSTYLIAGVAVQSEAGAASFALGCARTEDAVGDGGSTARNTLRCTVVESEEVSTGIAGGDRGAGAAVADAADDFGAAVVAL